MTIGGAMTLMFVLHAEACLAFLAMDRPGMASVAMAIGLAWEWLDHGDAARS